MADPRTTDPLAGVPLSSIRVFEAAARLKSFTRAAAELGMTQAAVSWQIKALETKLSLSLFRRLPREVALTEPGERLARAATEAMLLLRRAFADLTEADQGVLSITTLATIGYGDVVPVAHWNLIGPATAMNGVLLFGWSTAVIFEILRRAVAVSSLGRPEPAGTERQPRD